jgi:glycosyltransferase involved in cell wall biosynthesis
MSVTRPLSILFVVPYVPSLIRVRPFNLIRALAERGLSITLLALRPPGDDVGGLPSLREWCKSVHVLPLGRGRILWNLLSAFPRTIPLQAAYSLSPQLESVLRSLVRQNRFDLIHLEHLRGAELVPTDLDGLPPVVFDSVDSISLLFQRAARGAVSWRSRAIARADLGRTQDYEAEYATRFARVLVTSPEDRDSILRLSVERHHDASLAERRLVVVPNGVDLGYFRPLGVSRESDTVVFSGKLSYHANTAAALDLVHEIMPIVWSERPDTKVWIVGKDPPKEVRDLTTDARVTITGTVPDVRPFVGRAALAVTPLRYGVGIQNKVLEAMALATPVVSTPGTCRAMQANPGEHLLIGETAAELAGHVLAALGDEVLRARLGAAGRRYVEQYHDWDTVAARLERIYRDTIASADNGGWN